MHLEDRTFQLKVPDREGRPDPAPLVVAFHGGMATGGAMRKLANLDARAEREGWLVAYPDSVAGHWNDGRGSAVIHEHRDQVDDLGWVARLVDHLVETAGADRDQVYATGFSNGAMFCHRIAVERPELVAAIAPVAGPMPEPLLDPGPTRAMPALLVHGTDDPVVPYAGGPVQGDPDRGRVASVEETAARWRAVNRCSTEGSVTEVPHRDPADRTRVRVRRWEPDDDGTGAEVVLVTVEGGGHTWPGGLQYQPQSRIGVTTGDVHASDLVVDFFRGKTRRA
ncbi:MAG: dienelactone hydrolase family protein [Actinomycetota bacterium]|nr:dienelactone hydrolase family protein [Actinomycetota bacterium]